MLLLYPFYFFKHCSWFPFFPFCYRFFLTWTIFKVFTEFVTRLLLFYVLVFWPGGMWDLSFPSRDRTCNLCIGRPSLKHWTTREILYCTHFKDEKHRGLERRNKMACLASHLLLDFRITKLGGLTQQKLFKFWRWKVQSQGVSRVTVLSVGCGEDPSLSLWFLAMPGILWAEDSSHPLPPLSSAGLLLWVPLCVFSFLSCIRAPFIG